MRGFVPLEWYFVGAPLSAALALVAMAFWVRIKPRRRTPALALGIAVWLVLLGGVLALALPFF